MLTRVLIKDVNSVDEGGLSALHHCLTGRHNSLMKDKNGLIKGDHEGIVRYLSTLPGFRSNSSCPLYYAVHYRNLNATIQLLAAKGS